MIISKIVLSNFRSFNKSEYSFSPGITVVVGPNASGKTNLIEAIFILGLTKSFRDIPDREAIYFGQEIGRISGTVEKPDNRSTNLEVILTKGEVTGIKTPYKKCQVNGVGKRIIDYVGNLKTVLFWPQDMELVTDSPSIRRKYLDFLLTQVDREYRRTLISYERGIRQRNRVLEAIREHGAHRHQLIFWDQLIIKAGEYITKKREAYIDFINSYELSETKFQIIGKYHLIYDKSIISKSRLEQYTKEEISSGVTLVGPHRDDVHFEIQSTGIKNYKNDFRDLSLFGSRGEQRLAILWLKICELAYIEKETGEKPVLLLDDIFSELDSSHQKIIFEVIENQQTILTTTDLNIVKKVLKKVKVINLP